MMLAWAGNLMSISFKIFIEMKQNIILDLNILYVRGYKLKNYHYHIHIIFYRYIIPCGRHVSVCVQMPNLFKCNNVHTCICIAFLEKHTYVQYAC